MINLRKSIMLFLALAALLMVSACTTERNAVDRSPEEALDKKLFEGEFFYRQTIVDLPYTADYSFIGESNDGVILKWKITKNWLIAYNIHDALEVTNTEYDPTVNETPVLAYYILEHFDILPMENTTTGEELPVITINTDKPWNERRYFMIDQSRSGLNNFQLKYMNMTEEWGAPYKRSLITSYWDMEFYAHDGSYIAPKKYKKMVESQKTGDNSKEVEWFMFYNKEYLIRVNDWNGIYTMDDVEEFTNYEPATIVYRHTFTKVNRDVVGRRTYDKETNEWSWKKGSIDNGFRPLEMRDEIFRQFGFFTNKFKGYDPITGYKEKDVHEMANYFNTAWSDGTNWNFTCADGQGTADAYPACASKIKHQQKLVFTSSPEMPRRMRTIDCAIAKDYNHALLAARFAAMNPGSDTREFETWYYNTHKDKDFWKNSTGGTPVRSEDWYMQITFKNGAWSVRDEIADADKAAVQKWADNWMSMCYVEDQAGFVQNWDGSFNEDKYTNDIVVLVHNPVEGYIPARDADGADFYANYENGYIAEEGNFAWVCVNEEEAKLADVKKLHYFETCEMNTEDDGYDCKIYTAKDVVCPEGKTKAAVSCVRTDERVCKVDGSGNPILRHKYMNGDNRVAMINWVDQPTEYGILGVSQWNVNPETGQSLGGGSNIAGSVLQWATSRAVELARMIIDEDDPAAWDLEKLMNPEYQEPPQVVFDNNPAVATKKKRAQSSVFKNEDMAKLLRDVKLPADINTKGVRADALEELQEAYLKSQNKLRFDFADVKDSKWANDLVPYSMKQRMFPWVTDPSSFTDEMVDVMSPLFSGIDVMAADMERYQGTIENCYLDIAFLDGALLKFLEEKIAKHSAIDYPTVSDRNDALLKDIYNDIELLMYKGVAQHEMGHTLGLRHNFTGSTDIENYKDPYFASENYPVQQAGIKQIVQDVYDQYPGSDEISVARRNIALSSSTNKIHEYINGKIVKLSDGSELQLKNKANYYTYTSVMDYQSEPYIHAVGLGKYDYAALKAVYGRSVEAYKTDADGYIAFDSDNVRGIRDSNYKFPVLINTPYIDAKTGKLATSIAKVRVKVEEDGITEYRVLPDYQRNELGELKKDGQFYLPKDDQYVINNGNIHRYLFESDEMRSDEPTANVFDTGFRATEIIRNMANADDKYYFLRYFWRGNPRFREYRGRTSMKMIYDTLFRKYAYVHFLLDFNYNVMRGGWFSKMPIWSSADGCNPEVEYPISDNESKMFADSTCSDYLKATEGLEYWLDDNGNLKSLEPMSPGDYLLGGMEGINYLIFNEIYRPAVDVYVGFTSEDDADIASKIEPSTGQAAYWVTNPYVVNPLETNVGKEAIEVSVADGGRYQRDHWDIQDDSTIYYEKVTRRGWAEERMVALYTLSNNGWFSGKYRRESMANGLGQQAEGIENVIFASLTDIANEDSITSFSPYCYNKSKKTVEKVNFPLTTFMKFRELPPFVNSGTVYDLPNNICALATAQSTDGTVYEPVHAGWTYFDKMYPLYWGMSNVMNVSADTQVLLKFVSLEIPVSERGQYADPDVDEVEYLNSSDTIYYRAKLATNYMTSEDGYDVRWWKNHKGTMTEAELDVALCKKNASTGACLEGAEAGRKYADEAEFRAYLANTYARFAPAFRLVSSAKIAKAGETASGTATVEPFYKLTIMETTLHQMNAYAADWFGSAVLYASWY